LLEVFGRRTSVPHAYEGSLSVWLSGACLLSRAMARNLMHDWRVSPEREAKFDIWARHPQSTRDLMRGIMAYHRHCVSTRARPDYLYDRLNSNNMVRRPWEPESSGIHKEYRLATILDLSGLDQVYQWAHDERLAPFVYLTDEMRSETRKAAWLRDCLEGQPQGEVEAFLKSVFEATNTYRVSVAGGRHQPVWATTWSALEPHLGGGPDRWLEVLGIARSGFPRWLVVLAYRVSEVGTLARPTQLDAGWSGFHFPSPPRAPLSTGGHPADLGTPAASASVLPEYIHSQIHYRIEYWVEAGRLIGQTTRPTPDDVASQRWAHHRRLCACYGPAHVKSWMAEPV
jgi:hypothetical protein